MAVTVRVELASAGPHGPAWWTARIVPAAGRARLLWLAAPGRGVRERPAPGATDEHVSAALTTPRGHGLQPYADVLHADLHDLPCRPDHALRRAADALRRYPGCAVAAVGGDDGLAVLTRTGECVRLRGGRRSCWRPAVIGSLVHAWIAAGRAASELRTLVAVQDGRGGDRASIRPASRSASNAPSAW